PFPTRRSSDLADSLLSITPSKNTPTLKLHTFSVGSRGHFPTAREVCSQQRRCRQPHMFGSGVSFTQASSARITSTVSRRFSIETALGSGNISQPDKRCTLILCS